MSVYQPESELLLASYSSSFPVNSYWFDAGGALTNGTKTATYDTRGQAVGYQLGVNSVNTQFDITVRTDGQKFAKKFIGWFNHAPGAAVVAPSSMTVLYSLGDSALITAGTVEYGGSGDTLQSFTLELDQQVSFDRVIFRIAKAASTEWIFITELEAFYFGTDKVSYKHNGTFGSSMQVTEGIYAGPPDRFETGRNISQGNVIKTFITPSMSVTTYNFSGVSGVTGALNDFKAINDGSYVDASQKRLLESFPSYYKSFSGSNQLRIFPPLREE